ncbi:hypothetical protein G436_1485 [Leptospira interrogans serovar Hardjo str. Norma]|uniref:Uncharacterized protein n=1 Tax=Leptospira interrogans serovar Hardjo str. Norma TaxID=1279460 RepID=A0A0M3TL92_LEPIR|nr:hypothetical protein G436_1485 [Leptospira interrogans serovar Hardjo str. Norma]EKO95785.1 hypothetical protein LEP1GSC057_0952 [Leptospira interrogans str. Brem 329]
MIDPNIEREFGVKNPFILGQFFRKKIDVGTPTNRVFTSYYSNKYYAVLVSKLRI